jgi:DNA-binding MarR family transcriptional regulator
MLNDQQREEWIDFIHAQHPEIDPRALRLMDEIRRVSHLLYQIGETSVASADLSYAQYRILMMLFFRERAGQTDGLNPSEISDRSGTSRNTISSLIRTLEEDGYVERELDSADRRKFNILLSDSGRSLVVDNIGRHMQIVDQIFSILSSDELDQLSQQLHRLNDRALAYKEATATAELGGSYATSR